MYVVALAVSSTAAISFEFIPPSVIIKFHELFRKSASLQYTTSDQPSHTHSPVQLSLLY